MRKTRPLHMHRWMLYYLVLMLIVMAVLLTLSYIGITAMVASATPSAVAMDAAGPGQIPWFALKLKLLLLMIGGFLVAACLGYVGYRILARKFEQSAEAVLQALEQLARGRLNETVSISTPDEFGRMGASVNELAANLQELLLYVWKHTGRCLTMLEHIHNNPDLRHDRRLTLESLGYLKQLTESVDDLREMAKSYVFYDVSLDGNKTLAINEPGKKS